MIGSHCIKTHSSTQGIIALSSGEAEFYGIDQAGSHGLGAVGILRDLGLEFDLQINTDSVAARSSCSRRGGGKVRHLHVQELWIWERVYVATLWMAIKFPNCLRIRNRKV